jgi:hypothetical protein
MSAFKSIVQHFAQSSISKLVQNTKHLCRPTNFSAAKTVLLLFDGRDAQQIKEVKTWATAQNGLTISCFYLAESETAGSSESFHKKETNWADLPKQDVVTRCSAIQADLCILFNPTDVPSLHFLAMAHPAGMKVTTASQFPTHADLVFDSNQTKMAVFLAEVKHFMENILV